MNATGTGRTAYISALARQAFVAESDRLWRLSVEGAVTDQVGSAELGQLLHLFHDVEEVAADVAPFEDVLRRLRAKCRLDAVSRLALSLLDQECPYDLQMRSVELLEGQLASTPGLDWELLALLLSLEFTEWPDPSSMISLRKRRHVATLLSRRIVHRHAVDVVRKALQEVLAAQTPAAQFDALRVIRSRHLVGWFALNVDLTDRSLIGSGNGRTMHLSGLQSGDSDDAWAELDAAVQLEPVAFSSLWRASVRAVVAQMYRPSELVPPPDPHGPWPMSTMMLSFQRPLSPQPNANSNQSVLQAIDDWTLTVKKTGTHREVNIAAQNVTVSLTPAHYAAFCTALRGAAGSKTVSVTHRDGIVQSIKWHNTTISLPDGASFAPIATVAPDSSDDEQDSFRIT